MPEQAREQSRGVKRPFERHPPSPHPPKLNQPNHDQRMFIKPRVPSHLPTVVAPPLPRLLKFSCTSLYSDSHSWYGRPRVFEGSYGRKAAATLGVVGLVRDRTAWPPGQWPSTTLMGLVRDRISWPPGQWPSTTLMGLVRNRTAWSPGQWPSTTLMGLLRLRWWTLPSCEDVYCDDLTNDI